MSHSKILEYSRIVKSFPFFFGEEFTELAIADSNGLKSMGQIAIQDTGIAHLVGTQLLHSVHILDC